MSKNSIWIGEKDLTQDESFLESVEQEFKSPNVLENSDVITDQSSNRRDFLKYLGFGVGAATVAAGCDIPIKRAIPYVIKPDEIVPGVATYYASSYVEGGDYCPILVKCREGRPIKVEGNDLSTMTHGGTSARAQAAVLGLYDTNRYKNPQHKSDKEFSDISWADLDKAIIEKLGAAKNVRIVTNTNISPSSNEAIKEFVAAYPSTKVVTYDPVSSSAMLEANEMSFGDRVIPGYRFDKADVIVSFNADFLGTWISPIEFANQYIKNRKVSGPKSKMSRHVQVESHMSMTGSNADYRILIKPSEQGEAIAFLHGQITGTGGGSQLNDKAKAGLTKIAAELKAAKGQSLVVSGSNNTYEQVLINDINNVLGNYGMTLGFSDASYQRQGNEGNLDALVSEMNGGRVDALIVMGANPAYDFAKADAFKNSLEKVATKIAVNYQPNETTALCNYIAPTHHFLESWGDAEPKRGQYSIIQPTIRPLFKTRQGEASLLTWANSSAYDTNAEQPYLDFIKAYWKSNMFGNQSEFASFQGFWDNALHDGVLGGQGSGTEKTFNVDVSLAKSKVSKPSNSELEIVFYETANMGNGQFSTNPWLQEMPDPVARTTWGNYLAVPVNFDGNKKFIGFNGLNDGDLAELTVGDEKFTLPVVKQFGMAPGTIALALGYGRSNAGKCGTGVGVNVNKVLTMSEGMTQYYSDQVQVSGTVGKEDHFSCVQYHHTIGVKATNNDGDRINADEATLGQTAYGVGITGYQGSLTERSVIYNSTLKDLPKKLAEMQKKRDIAKHLNDATLYPFDEYTENLYSQGHHWGMHVDLNSCIGCNACTVACVAENNVPVVGKKEVSRHHEMTWLRIDRYYFGEAENPNVVYQPMMCQHCDNAPCENVCPVNATNHSSEGLNQMAYNRCVGTRYCANNCPYKVRRFNWLDYTTADIFPGNQPTLNSEEIPFGADNLTRMVLNPDVTVRSRGVIEKCSFCVQRIQEGKLTAKSEGRRLQDTDVRTACQSACPTGAITFGDRNNKKGDLSKLWNSQMNYIALEEVNVQSSVNYTMKVVNRDESLDA
ncbi:MAG: TAT-variant-translocated molybdopterin oxidoreductase [Saprospiraceae bacterium]|nr:TAT-variant-translocated molybdopterin oxidoreductase [Bacteroidia bacterium]NNE13879.1 TAT-variant-translocated molybdopterin oxidoreductase [Saprospiraceae bacterium]NNL92711.1 TAT-variant-translocated molybdopterin oxidoreductase [Saprospiraceae bacterium]